MLLKRAGSLGVHVGVIIIIQLTNIVILVLVGIFGGRPLMFLQKGVACLSPSVNTNLFSF